MKYIVELKPEYEDSFKGVMVLGAKDNNLFVDVLAVDDLELLNSDYINEHFGDLQDEAYLKGLREGKKAFDLLDAERDSEYQRGLDAAWEAARKIVTWPDRSLINSDTFDLDHGENIFTKYSASEAIAKLKAYEEKQKADELKVGDEVAFHHDDGRPDTVVVVTYIGKDGFIDGMDGRGTQYAHKNPTKWTKTGRHFDIDKILEEMKE